MTARRTVLVVDDDARTRAALVRALDESPGLRAVGLEIEQAVLLSAGGAPLADAIVLDAPRADHPAVRAVAALARTAPVIVTSLSSSVAGPVLAEGAAAFVEKDGDAEALVAAISSHARASAEHNQGRRGKEGNQ